MATAFYMSYTPRHVSDYNRAMIFSLRAPVAMVVIALAGCTGTEPVDATAPVPRASSNQKVTPPKPMPKTINPVPSAIMDRLYAEVSEASGVTRDAITLVRAQAATWGDGSLGCPQPNQEYAQMIMHGYWVILRAGNEEFDYRIDRNQRHRRCTGATRRAPIVYPSDT